MPNVEFAKKAVVKVTQRSAFDKSFRNLLTTKCGTLTPILCDEVIPNTTVNLKLAMSATLPPLASETFMNVNLKTEAFFVPFRLLMQGAEKFFMGEPDIQVGYSAATFTDAKIRVPVITLNPSQAGTTNYFGTGSLADYLGLRCDTLSQTVEINALPFIAYHYVYSTWYRNSLVQVDPFQDSSHYNTSNGWTPAVTHYKMPYSNSNTTSYKTTLDFQFLDGVRLGQLRQRNFGSDYFTTATPSPQNGTAQKVSMQLPSSIYSNGGEIEGKIIGPDNTGISTLRWDQGEQTGSAFLTTGWNEASFTIASLRAANSLQIWLERNNLSNSKWVDFLKVQYNADLKDSIAQRPVYLGSASFPVYSKGIYQTSADSNSGNNPFDSVGSRYGHAYAEGTDFIIDHYTAEEPGYIMVFASIVPEVTYSGGVNKYLMRYVESDSYGEMANPILQNVGPEPIRLYEFDSTLNADDSFGVFGYTDRYGSWMTRNHELHGLLRDGSSLESFALQRSGVTDGIGSQFLQIPSNYMDQVTAVDSAISNYGVWIDTYLDYKVVMPLAKYSIPSLQDPAYEHGQTVVVNRRGRIIE